MSCRSKFNVIYASSRDSQFVETSLQNSSQNSQGWLSARFSSYPQLLVFELEEHCHIKQLQILSHQYSIATKIDVYLAHGDPQVADWKDLDWNRIGFLSLDKNERSSFRSRELKSVYLDHQARYIKLSLRESHVNHINVFNQVGIVAFNVLADIVSKESLNDLGTSMEFDGKTMEYLQALQQKKKEAVEEEDYDEAKRVKIIIDRIIENKDHLTELELEKKQAVLEEDYDRAKRLKIKIDTIRSSFVLRAPQPEPPTRPERPSRRPLEPASIQNPPYQVPEPMHPEEAKHVSPIQTKPRATPSLPFDDQPLPALRPNSMAPENSPIVPPRIPFEDLPLPTLVKKKERPKKLPTYQDDEDTDFDYEKQLEEMVGESPKAKEESRINQDDLPELHESARKDNYELVELLGDDIAVRCLYDSKNWNNRSEAYNQFEDFWDHGKLDKRDIPVAFRESVRVGRMGVNDKVMGVQIRSCKFLTTLIENHSSKISRKVVIENLSTPISEVVMKLLSHNNPRVSEAAATMLRTFAYDKKIGPMNIMKKLLKPLPKKQKGKPKPLMARGKLLLNLIENLSFPKEIELDHMMVLVMQMLQHKNSEVRNTGVQLCVECYSHFGKPTLRKLKNCTDLLKETLNQAFADRTGESNLLQRDPKSDKERNRPSRKRISQAAPSKKRKNKPRKKRKPRREDVYESPVSVARSPKHTSKEVREVNYSPEQIEEVQMIPQDDDEMNYCNFCREYNPAFGEDDDDEALDIHYFQDCPMLTACAYCEQIVETSGLVEHIINECEAVDQKHKMCPSCRDPFPTDIFYDHVGSQTCRKVPDNKDKCPLCKTFILQGEESWQQHLCYECTANERRRPS